MIGLRWIQFYFKIQFHSQFHKSVRRNDKIESITLHEVHDNETKHISYVAKMHCSSKFKASVEPINLLISIIEYSYI